MSKRSTILEQRLRSRELHVRGSRKHITELRPQHLNVSAGGNFYEKAKLRNARTKHIFRNTLEGRTVVRDAVALGRKTPQKNLNPPHYKRGSTRSSSIMRSVSEDRNDNADQRNTFRFSAAAVARRKASKDTIEERQKKINKFKVAPSTCPMSSSCGSSPGTNVTIKKPKIQELPGSVVNPVDLTADCCELNSVHKKSKGIGFDTSVLPEPEPSSLLPAAQSSPLPRQPETSLFQLCEKDVLDLNEIAELLEPDGCARDTRRNENLQLKNHDCTLAMWACCTGKLSTRHCAAFVMLLNAGADVNAVSKKLLAVATLCNDEILVTPSVGTDVSRQTFISILDSLYTRALELENISCENNEASRKKLIKNFVKVAVSFGAKFYQFSNCPDAEKWKNSHLN